MKAITLIQPYATLIALGYKANETRSWQTTHRGPLAIHAGIGMPSWAREVAETDSVISSILHYHGLTFDTLPRRRVLAVAKVAGMLRIVEPGTGIGLGRCDPALLSVNERASGGYMLGRWAWQLENVLTLAEPVACSGAQSIWQVPADIAQRVAAAPAALCPPKTLVWFAGNSRGLVGNWVLAGQAVPNSCAECGGWREQYAGFLRCTTPACPQLGVHHATPVAPAHE